MINKNCKILFSLVSYTIAEGARINFYLITRWEISEIVTLSKKREMSLLIKNANILINQKWGKLLSKIFKKSKDWGTEMHMF